jgi:hypothetical protein
VEFNRALGSALLVYNLTQESVVPFLVKALLKIIVPNRYKGVLSGIPMKIEKVIDLRLLLVIRKHDMRTEASRKECVSCKIDRKAFRETR